MRLLTLLLSLAFAQATWAKPGINNKRFPFFAYLTGAPTPKMICYTPSQLDPRQEANHRRLRTSSIRADLTVLRKVFDGLILYGYHESSTPRILALAKDLKFRAILLGIWEVKSADEIDGAAKLALHHADDFALAVRVGNEGITFKRYEPEDLTIATKRLRKQLPMSIPITTSEPLEGYAKSQVVRQHGDFLAPNVHPVFHQPKLSMSEAATWARSEAARLGRELKKPVLLQETGYAHGGRANCSIANQKAFWQAYLKPGHLVRSGDQWCCHAAAFEAFDLPWKAEASGMPVEKHWGFFSMDRKPHPALEVWKRYSR